MTIANDVKKIFKEHFNIELDDNNSDHTKAIRKMAFWAATAMLAPYKEFMGEMQQEIDILHREISL